MNRLLLFLITISTAAIIITGSDSLNKLPQVAGASTGIYQNVKGLVLPHHGLASVMTIQALSRIASDKADTEYIVVFSPNHFRPQSETFTSTDVLLDFPIAQSLVNQIKNAYPNLMLDETLLENEHGLTEPMKYLRQYFPNAKLVPFAISPYFTETKLSNMAATLNTLLPDNTIFAASTDFSHKHLALEASALDQETITAIKNFDYQRLWHFDDNNLDCPACMGILMKVMEQKGALIWRTWDNSHGSWFVHNPLLQGTSYVTGVFQSN